MFIKKKIFIKSGNGGNGIISFKKSLNKYYPDGGNGGDGGDFYIVSNNNTKKKLKNFFFAKNGFLGKNKNQNGKKGKNKILNLPLGSLIEFRNKKIYFTNKKIYFKLLNGGKGGIGNYNFRHLYNSKIATKGKTGALKFFIYNFKFFLKKCILNLNNDLYNFNNFYYYNNFISKIYIVFINLNLIKIFVKIIKFFFFFLYLKNLSNNIYWIIIDNIENKINFFILKKIRLIIFPFFFCSKIYFIGYKKILHYYTLWKNS